MAQIFQINVYQINSNDPIPLASVPKWGFPSAGVMVRTANDSSGNAGALLSTGVRCYGQVNVLANGSTFLTDITAASIITLSNA
jgi:hypothetical protein